MFGPCSCSAIWDFVCEEILDSKRIGESTIVGEEWRGFIMVRPWRETWIELCIGEFAIPRTCAARCSPLSEGWSCVVEWWRERDDDGKGIGGVNEVNESDTIVVVDGDWRREKNGRWLHSEKMQHRRSSVRPVTETAQMWFVHRLAHWMSNEGPQTRESRYLEGSPSIPTSSRRAISELMRKSWRSSK